MQVSDYTPIRRNITVPRAYDILRIGLLERGSPPVTGAYMAGRQLNVT